MESNGVSSFGNNGLLPAYPVIGIGATVRCGDGWGRSWAFGGVLTAVRVRVSSEAESRT